MRVGQTEQPLTWAEHNRRRRFRAFRSRQDRPARRHRLLRQISAYSMILALSVGSYLALQRLRPEPPMPVPQPLPEIIHPQAR